MNRDQGIGILLAVAVHALALGALRTSRPPAPRPIGEPPVEVDLVSAAPEPASSDAPPPEEPLPPEAPSPPSQEPPPSPTPPPPPAPRPEPQPALKTPPPSPSRPKPATTRKSPPAPRRAATPPRAPAQKSSSANHQGGNASDRRADSPPGYRNNPQPEYPAEARQLGQQGLVILDVLVNANGRAAKITLARSSGVRALDQAALAAVRRWTFQPARAAGVPVVGRVQVPVRFRLER